MTMDEDDLAAHSTPPTFSRASTLQPAAKNAYVARRLTDLAHHCFQVINQKQVSGVRPILSAAELLIAFRELSLGDVEGIADHALPSVYRIDDFVRAFGDRLFEDQGAVSDMWNVLLASFNAADSLATRSPQILQKLMDILVRFSHELESNRLLAETLNEANTDVMDVLTDILCTFVEFWLVVIPLLRELIRSRQAESAISQTSLKRLSIEKSFIKSGDGTDLILKKLHERSELAMEETYKRYKILRRRIETLRFHSERSNKGLILKELGAMGLGNIESKNVKLPCHTLPFSKNPKFFVRDAIMNEIRDTLDVRENNRTFRSMALWGMAGIGKTQLALGYAWDCWENGVEAVFWVSSEESLDILEGFTKIGQALELPGIIEGAHEPNRNKVLHWFQTTDVHWVLVLDNVEDPLLIQSCWPESASSGSVLITSRNEAVGVELQKCFPVPVLSKDEGSKYLELVIDRSSYSQDEILCAQKLSQAVDGHALTLQLMGQQIRLNRNQIKQFLTKYQQTGHVKVGVKSKYYKRSLDTVFNEAFTSLGDDARHIMGVACLLAPDGIPEELFLTIDREHLPKMLKFCASPEVFDDALLELLSKSLLNKNPDTLRMNVHRLVQEYFRTFLQGQTDDLYQSFLCASHLLVAAFPKQKAGSSLRSVFHVCKSYAPHVMAMCDRLMEFKFQALRQGDMEDFCRLAQPCLWYLMESGSWVEFWHVFNAAESVCEDRDSLLYADLCNIAGQVEVERARTDTAKKFFNISLRIREEKLPPDHGDLADLYNNYANCLNVEWRDEAQLEEALEYFQKATNITMAKPEEERSKVAHIRHANLGTLFTCQGKWDLARTQLEQAHEWALKLHGPGSHWDATIVYKLANIHYYRGNWDAAQDGLERALQIFLKSDQFHPTVTATQLKLATISMKQNHCQQAIELLRRNILVCELNESKKGDRGDTARHIRRLADALRLDGQLEDADKYWTQAEEIRKEVQGKRYAELSDCERSYNLMVYKALW